MIRALKNGPTFAQWGDFRSEKNILQYFENARLFRLLLEWEPKCDEPLLERLRLKIYPYFVDNPPPLAWEDCSVNPCPTQYKWHLEDWGDCSKSCGGGIQRRKKICAGKDMISTSWKLCKEEPPITRKRYGNDNNYIFIVKIKIDNNRICGNFLLIEWLHHSDCSWTHLFWKEVSLGELVLNDVERNY